MGFLQQEYCSGLPFPTPVDHVLSEPSTMTRQSWVALHSMADHFIELHKPLCHDKAVIHEGAHIIWIHLNGMSRIGKFIENIYRNRNRDQKQMSDCQGPGEEEMEYDC